MPRIIVEAEGRTGEVVLWERVGAGDFDAEHFRRCLADRLAWAVRDAEEVEEAGGVVVRDEGLVRAAAAEDALDPEPVFA
jgi:hypothetical protein